MTTKQPSPKKQEIFCWKKHGKAFGYIPGDQKAVASPLALKVYKGFTIKKHA